MLHSLRVVATQMFFALALSLTSALPASALDLTGLVNSHDPVSYTHLTLPTNREV